MRSARWKAKWHPHGKGARRGDIVDGFRKLQDDGFLEIFEAKDLHEAEGIARGNPGFWLQAGRYCSQSLAPS